MFSGPEIILNLSCRTFYAQGIQISQHLWNRLKSMERVMGGFYTEARPPCSITEKMKDLLSGQGHQEILSLQTFRAHPAHRKVR